MLETRLMSLFKGVKLVGFEHRGPLLDPWTIAGIGEIDVEIVTNPPFSTFVSASMLGRNHK